MLRYSIVGDIHLAKVDSIADVDQWFQKFVNTRAILCRQESLNVLENEGSGTVARNDPRKCSDERVPCVVVPPKTR